MAITKVYLTQYSASVDDSPVLLLGTKDSYGNEQLQIIRSPEWEDLIITATFAAGDTPLASPVLVPEDGLIDVPAGATAERLPLEACGVITFCGVADGVQRISTSLPYLVSDHGPIKGTVPAPTPSEWEQFVAQVKSDADRAKQGAADAENAANAAKESLDEIGTAVEDAKNAAAAAAQSAKEAAAESGKVQEAAKSAVSDIDAAMKAALPDIDSAKNSAVSEVNDAGATQTKAVASAGSAALASIGNAQQTTVQAVQQAGTAEAEKVNSAGAAQTKAVQDEGAEQVQAVTEAGDTQAQRLTALVPEVYTKAESDGRYAPIGAAIKVSGKGTGLVSLSPTVAWGMQGLKLYGRSWQDGTPSTETEVPIQDAGQSGQINVQITDGGSKSQQLPILTPDGLPGIPVNSGGTWTDEDGQQWVSDVVDLAVGTKTQNVYTLRVSDYLNTLAKSSNPSGDTYYISVQSEHITIPNQDNNRNFGMLSNYFEAGNAYFNTIKFDIANIISDIQQPRFCFGPIGSMPTLEDAKAWFEAHDVILMYPLATPTTTTLDDETVAAYKALQSHPGTTNVLAPDCGIEASAVGDATQIIANITQKVAALESAATGI